jgi:hypothetical protein
MSPDPAILLALVLYAQPKGCPPEASSAAYGHFQAISPPQPLVKAVFGKIMGKAEAPEGNSPPVNPKREAAPQRGNV